MDASTAPLISVISVTAPRLWNDLPPELRIFSLPPPSSLQIINHHLHHAPLSVTPGLSTRNWSSNSSKSLSLTHLILFLPTRLLNYTRLNAYNLPPLTFWQPDLSFPRTILWKTPLIWRILSPSGNRTWASHGLFFEKTPLIWRSSRE